jgi:hypothetical protein
MSAFGSCNQSFCGVTHLPIITGYTGVKPDLVASEPAKKRIDGGSAKFGVVDRSVAGHKQRSAKWKYQVIVDDDPRIKGRAGNVTP